MMAAGKRDRRIVFQRRSLVSDDYGEQREAFAPIGSRLAQVLFGSGAERRSAASEGATQTATFRVLADRLTSSVGVVDRIAYGGLTYDITGIASIGRLPDELEFTGVAPRG